MNNSTVLLTKLINIRDYCIDNGALEGETRYGKALVGLGKALSYLRYEGVDIAFKDSELFQLDMDNFTYLNKLNEWADDVQDEILLAVEQEYENREQDIQEESAVALMN